MDKITVALLLLGAICGDEALQCYQCTDCNTVSSSSLKTCGGNDTSTEPENPNTNGTSYDFFDVEIPAHLCAKITVEGPHNFALTNRQCVEPNELLDLFELMNSSNITLMNVTSVELKVCSTDACNGTSNLQTSLAFVVTAAFFLYFK